MTHQVVFGWPIVAEQILLGTAAGSFIVSALLDLFGKGQYTAYSRRGFSVAALASILGLIVLVAELGRPERAPNAILNLLTLGTSVMSATTPIISAFVGGSVIMFLLSLKPTGLRPLRLFFEVAGIVVAIPTAMQAGLLIQAATFRNFWFTPVFPYLYLVSALLSGIGVVGLFLVRKGYTEMSSTVFSLMSYALLLIILQSAVLFAHFFTVEAPIEVATILSNPFPLYAPMFYVGTILIGMLLPGGVSLTSLRGGATPSKTSAAVVFAFLIVGALAMRIAFLFSGQVV